MIKLKVTGLECVIEAEGTPTLMISELCVAAEHLVKEICAGAPSRYDKEQLRETLTRAISCSLLEGLHNSTEGGPTQ